MTATIHHKVHTEHLQFVLARRALLGIGGSFWLAPDSDRHPQGHDRHGHGAKHESAGRVSGIGGKDEA